MERDVLILATGGTIAMRAASSDTTEGRAGAVPTLDAAALVAEVAELRDVPGLRAQTLIGAPGAHLSTTDALAIARAAVSAADQGAGVVVTHGTDTLEETAFLTDLLYGGAAPIVFTGAIRPASAAGADGPSNLIDAVAVARAPQADQLGVVVVFGGEVHGARHACKVDSAGPAAFASPAAGPIGRVVEGRLALHARPLRPARVLAPDSLSGRVAIHSAALGDALPTLAIDADGAVVVVLGGGHLLPAALVALTDAIARMPVVATVRPARGAFLRTTYGFHGAEADLRAAGAIPAGALSAAAARIKLLACLGAGLGGARLADAFAGDEA